MVVDAEWREVGFGQKAVVHLARLGPQPHRLTAIITTRSKDVHRIEPQGHVKVSRLLLYHTACLQHSRLTCNLEV